LELVVAEAEAGVRTRQIRATGTDRVSNAAVEVGQAFASGSVAEELTWANGLTTQGMKGIPLANSSGKLASVAQHGFDVEITSVPSKETPPEELEGPTRQIELLKVRKETLRDMYEHVRRDVLDLGEKNRRVSEAKDELERLNQQRNDAQDRINALALETRVGGRIRTLSVGNRPGSPVNLHTRGSRAVIGGLVGMVLGGVIVGLAGWKKRCRC
jgi:hypothetical protein